MNKRISFWKWFFRMIINLFLEGWNEGRTIRIAMIFFIVIAVTALSLVIFQPSSEWFNEAGGNYVMVGILVGGLLSIVCSAIYGLYQTETEKNLERG